jgi:hypothetical protein
VGGGALTIPPFHTFWVGCVLDFKLLFVGGFDGIVEYLKAGLELFFMLEQ